MKYKPSKDSIYSNVDNEVVIMSLSEDQYISLNEVGSRIWELISESPQSIDELVSKLLQEYDVEEATCRVEVTGFIEELMARNLIEKLG